MNFKITEIKPDKEFRATLTDVTDSIFCGSGSNIAEAIGSCLIANREACGVTFEIKPLDGEILYSTVYGKARVAKE